MAQPTLNDAHVNSALTQISVAYKQGADAFVADKIFPTVSVEKQAGKIFKFDKNDWLRDEAGIRAPGTESQGGGFDISSSTTYFCDVHAYHKDVADQFLAGADIDNLETQMSEFVVQKLLLERERDFVSNAFTAGSGTWLDPGSPNDPAGHASNSTWPYFIYFDDAGDSDPLRTVQLGKQEIQSATGYVPNTLLVGQEVHDVLRLHPDVKEQYKYTQPALVNKTELAELFGVENYYVGSSVYASNVEGATAAYSYNFGKNMLLCYVPPTPGILTPSAGYTFEWTGLNGLGYNVSMDDFYMREIKSTRIEGEMAYDAKVLCSDLGILFNGAIS